MVDVFDALTSRRPYKEPLSCDDACKFLIKERGAHFDPAIVDHFLRVLGPTWREIAEQPIGALHEGLKAAINVYFPQMGRSDVLFGGGAGG